ncbi:MAG TPA: DUF3341 domain-containing protein [Anaerolineae bacterium]|nr:DUF3341 domain-containing protein [Anaerolineae bacterium]
MVKNDKFPLYGLIAEFKDAEDLLAAARRARGAGYRRMEAFSPYPMAEVAEVLGVRGGWLPWIVFAGGLLGAAGGFALQYYVTVWVYPLNVGGRPLFSWPAFIPAAFETSILLAGLAALLGMLLLNRLPQPYHPVFNVPRFSLASQDRFFLAIKATDPHFDPEETWLFLEGLRPVDIAEIMP